MNLSTSILASNYQKILFEWTLMCAMMYWWNFTLPSTAFASCVTKDNHAERTISTFFYYMKLDYTNGFEIKWNRLTVNESQAIRLFSICSNCFGYWGKVDINLQKTQLQRRLESRNPIPILLLQCLRCSLARFAFPSSNATSLHRALSWVIVQLEIGTWCVQPALRRPPLWALPGTSRSRPIFRRCDCQQQDMAVSSETGVVKLVGDCSDAEPFLGVRTADVV